MAMNTDNYERQYLEKFAAACRAQSVVVPHAQTGHRLTQLDDHQTEAMEKMASAVEKGIEEQEHRVRGLITHCCGSGKTWVQTDLAIASTAARKATNNDNGKDILIGTERAAILQLEEYCAAAGLDAGVWGAGRRQLDRQTLITTIQALQMNRRSLQQLLGNNIHLLVGDEADLYLTGPRSQVIQQIPAIVKAGFTGTPRLPDGKHASQVWGEVLSSLSLRDGILRGKNVPPYYYLYGANVDESSFEMRGDDYDPNTIAAALAQIEIWNALPDLYERLIPIDRRRDVPALIFLPNIDLVRSVTTEFRRRHGDTLDIRYWTGEDTTSGELKDDIGDFDSGNIHILGLCEMGGRSLNFVTARALFDCYPTQSLRKYEQRVARVMRRIWPGSDLYNRGMRKEGCTIVQIVPTRRKESHYFRPVTLPDILGEDTWADVREGRPLLANQRVNNEGSEGAPALQDIINLREQIQAQNPRYTLELIQELDVLRELRLRGSLPRADLGAGQFYLGRRYARRRPAT